jgi:DNA (cytosine-5)-methyltransferase 1
MSDERLTVGSLFTGIGGFDLGLERAGMRVVWQCEQDEFCRRVLARHWPGVPCHPDVRALVADAGEQRRDGRPCERDAGREAPVGGEEGGHAGDGGGARGDEMPVPVPYVDVLCGGFPCQDLSVAGRQAGIDGRRSGLWGEYVRLIDVLRPRYVIVENVRNLLAGDRGRWFGRVLGDLAACGYDAEWDCIPASAVGAPHRRDRVWLVAYPQGSGREARGRDGVRAVEGPGQGSVARPDGAGDVAYPDGGGLQERPQRDGGTSHPGLEASLRDNAERRGLQGWWELEPDVGRVAHGIPDRVHRLRALGNALVPQIAEWLGRRIVAHEEEARQAQAAGVA